MEAFAGLLREGLVVTALLCVPVLAIATGVGTIVAVLQAATQVQEQTLALFPKLLAVVFALAIFGATGMHLCAGLFNTALAAVPAIIAAP